jgi:hypothetical protein
MMLLLVRNVRFGDVKIGRADREEAVTSLPSEVLQIIGQGLCPFGGVLLHGLQKLDRSVEFRQGADDMHVVRRAPDVHRVAFHVAENAGDVRVDLGPNIRREKGMAVLGGENDVSVKAE